MAPNSLDPLPSRPGHQACDAWVRGASRPDHLDPVSGKLLGAHGGVSDAPELHTLDEEDIPHTPVCSTPVELLVDCSLDSRGPSGQIFARSTSPNPGGQRPVSQELEASLLRAPNLLGGGLRALLLSFDLV